MIASKSASGPPPGSSASGPLVGTKVIELAGIGPAPFCAMLLADMGADVIRVDRATSVPESFPEQPGSDPLNRGRRSLGVNLKDPAGVEVALRLAETADILLEGFRPGVAERLGVGPEVCLQRNPKLVYGRMTGWGQTGPYAAAAGHDLNYNRPVGSAQHSGCGGRPAGAGGELPGRLRRWRDAVGLRVGVCHAVGAPNRPRPGGGCGHGGRLGAAWRTMVYGMRSMGVWGDRGENLLDGGAYYYGVYECADGGYVSIGSLEPQFFAELVRLTGADEAKLTPQGDQDGWVASRQYLESIFKTKTRAEWCAIMEGSDVCFAPVLSLDEAPVHPHNVARGSFMQLGVVTLPAPAPRFSETPAGVQRPAPHPGQHTEEVLADWGFAANELAELRATGAVA